MSNQPSNHDAETDDKLGYANPETKGAFPGHIYYYRLLQSRLKAPVVGGLLGIFICAFARIAIGSKAVFDIGLGIAAISCVLCLIVIVPAVISDFARFSIIRAWAISSVCFQQAIRRRVLWMTPLVILAIIVVTQLARPFDPQDDIRQATKFCLFATGLLLVMVIIILACTNLPKEIETRVIYTIATKPTTRFEIIVGKILGFSRVSAAILLIMGVFTFAFLEWRASTLLSIVRSRLETNSVESVNRPTLEYYAAAGLLHARDYGMPIPDGLQVYSTVPTKNKKSWNTGSSGQEILIPFKNFAVPLKKRRGDAGPEGKGSAFTIITHLDYRQIGPSPSTAPATQASATRPATSPATAPTTAATTRPAHIAISIHNSAREAVVNPQLTGTRQGLRLTAPNQPAESHVEEQAVELLQNAGDTIYVCIAGLNHEYEYSADPGSLKTPRVEVFVPELNQTFKPIGRPIHRGLTTQIYGQEIAGSKDGKRSVAVYQFRKVKYHPDQAGNCPFELHIGVERGSDADAADLTDADMTRPTSLIMTFTNLKTSKQWTSGMLSPESMRSMFFNVPKSAIEGGDFDVAIRCLTPGQRVGFKGPLPKVEGVQASSLRIVSDNQSFAFNLCKSLFVMWLMSVLVIIISVFCSTFVSWPIAVVLTLVLLLSHWGVQQIGASSGIGRQVATDLFKGATPVQAHAISETVEGLNTMLTHLSKFLPDIAQFASSEQIEAGVAVPLVVIKNSLRVTLLFGIPMLLLSYIFLKYKEVAP